MDPARDMRAICYLGVHRKKDIVLAGRAVADAGTRRRRHAFGAHLETGEVAPEFLLRRLGGSWPVAPFQPTSRRFEAACIYGGVWLNQFGHFLIESLSRYWWISQRPDLPVVWHAKRDQIAGWQRQVLDLLGIRNEFIFVDEPVAFTDIRLPDPGLMIDSFASAMHVAALARFPFRPPVAGRRVWLSRSGLLRSLSRIEGEEEIEAALGKRGWTIFHPERHSVADQLLILSKCLSTNILNPWSHL